MYMKNRIKRVVNASGRVTILGVSTLSDEVAQAAIEGGQSYVVIDDLINRAGEIISGYTGGEDSCVTSSASAAICLTIAGLISRGKKSIIDRLPDSTGLPNEIVLQKGTALIMALLCRPMIRLGGGVRWKLGQPTRWFRKISKKQSQKIRLHCSMSRAITAYRRGWWISRHAGYCSQT